MRSDSHTPPAGEAQLTLQRIAAAAGVLLLAAAATGGAASLVTPLLVLPLILLIRHAPSRLVVLAPAACAALLLLVTGLRYEVDLRAALGAATLLVGGYAGSLWRRESRGTTTRLAQLDEILAHEGRDAGTAAARAAAELEDLQRTMHLMAERLGAAVATLWTVDGSSGLLRPVASTSARPLSTVRLLGDPLGWVWSEGMRLRIDATPSWAPAGTVVIAERLRRDGDFGEVVSYAFAPDRPPPDDAAFEIAAVMLRAIIAVHAERAGAAAHSQRVRALTAGLRRIPDKLQVQVEAFALELCAMAMSVTDATGAIVGVWDGVSGQILAVGGTDGGPRPGDTFSLPDSELALALRADTMLTRDGSEWSLGRTAVAQHTERWFDRPRSLSALPLRGATDVVGVLGVWSSRSRTLDPDSLELLHLLSPYAALHLEHARAFGKLREAADRDPLSQLRNRRAFDEIFAAETARFERYTRTLSLLMIDIDHFKSVNDRFGHEAGDEVLRRVARLLDASVRDTDTAARFGGEEFVVLLPETTLAAATDVAERMRSGVAALEIDWRGTAIPVRVSIGVSAAPTRVRHPAELLASADSALYRAKETGRDRVVVAGDPDGAAPDAAPDLPLD